MSRSAALILCGCLLAACAGQDSPAGLDRLPGEGPGTPATAQAPLISDWLELQQEVLLMQADEVAAELARIGPDSTAGSELFYLGLLNQQVKDYNHWIAARDVFRELREDPGLDTDQRQLAGILERYNQSRINWYSRQNELLERYRLLQRELDTLDDEKAALEQKIQALTDLEAVISTRKEQ
jgi:hypothetical protein